MAERTTVARSGGALRTSAWGHSARTWHRRVVRPLRRDAILLARHLQKDRFGHRPDFLIVGVQKAGTTALFEELTALPTVGSPLVKETHYFDLRRSRPQHWYFDHFWADDRSRPLLWGEATPAYFDTPALPADITRMLPDVKIIVTLRDPVARAISHYFHAVEFGLEQRSIAAAFADEVRLLSNGGWSDADDLLRRGYLARSCYSTGMRRWLDVLPRERICVVVSERRRAALHEAALFLGAAQGEMDENQLRDSNSRPYRVPEDLDITEVAALLRADAEDVRTLLGWPEVPGEWAQIALPGSDPAAP